MYILYSVCYKCKIHLTLKYSIKTSLFVSWFFSIKLWWIFLKTGKNATNIKILDCYNINENIYIQLLHVHRFKKKTSIVYVYSGVSEKYLKLRFGGNLENACVLLFCFSINNRTLWKIKKKPWSQLLRHIYILTPSLKKRIIGVTSQRNTHKIDELSLCNRKCHRIKSHIWL